MLTAPTQISHCLCRVCTIAAAFTASVQGQEEEHLAAQESHSFAEQTRSPGRSRGRGLGAQQGTEAGAITRRCECQSLQHCYQRCMLSSEVLKAELDKVQGSAAFSVACCSTQDVPLVYASDCFCQSTGYSVKEVLGRNCRFLQGRQTTRRSVSMKETLACSRQAAAAFHHLAR